MIENVDLAVVLSGGGSRGAFQVGVLDALVRRGGLDVGLYAGVSTGAIQALGAAENRIADLRAVWEGIRGDKDIYKTRFLGKIGAIAFGKDSLFDATPVRRKIRAFHDPASLAASGKGLLIGTVSLQTGRLQIIDETMGNIAEWVIASAAVPATYQPLVDSAGGQWVDGGVRDITPLGAVIDRKPKAILVILGQPLGAGAGDKAKSFGGILDIALRAASILTDEVFEGDVAQARRMNALLNARDAQMKVLEALPLTSEQRAAAMAPLLDMVRNFKDVPIGIIAPDASFPLPDSIDFDPAKIRAGIRHGEEVAGRQATRDMLDRLKLGAGLG